MNRQYKNLGAGILGLILTLILINASCPRKPTPLIKEVKLFSIIADTKIYGQSAGEAGKRSVPPPWQARFKVTLDEKVLDRLRRNSKRDTLDFEGTSIDFRSRALSYIIDGFNFHLQNGILRADFVIPDTIPKWNFEKDKVFMAVKITAEGPDQLGFLLPLLLLESGDTTVTGQEEIDIFNKTPGIKAEVDEDGNTILSGPMRGTKLGC